MFVPASAFRLRCLALAFLLGPLALGCARDARPVSTADAVLPLRTVRLYETGVGYFEREGALPAGGGVALPVPSSHLDDALKSLVVLDGGAGATIGGLEFDASVTAGMARALAGLPKDAAPRMGLVLRNDTGQTLPAGPLAVYADGGFAGETVLDRLKPGERRWLGFGADLDVEVEATTLDTQEEAREVSFEDQRLREHFVQRERREVRIVNRGGQARTVEYALDVVDSSRVEGADGVERDPGTGATYVLLEVPARERVARTITVQQGLARVTHVDSVDAEALARLVASPAVPAGKRAVLAAAADPQRELERAHRERVGTTAALADVEADLERLRAHLEALGGDSGGAAAPLVRRVLDTEDRLAQLRLEMPERDAEVTRRRAALVAALGPLGEQGTVAEGEP